MKKKNKRFLYNAAMTIVCFAFLVCASTFLVLLIKPLYYMMVKLLEVPAETGYSFEICKTNYDILIDYNMFWGPKELVFRDFPMSIYGRIHFEEVKAIFVAMQYTAIVSFVLLIAGFIASKKNKCYGWLKATVVLAICVVVVVGAGFIIDWDGTFTLMHHILFDNDYWIFDPALDPVIWILPDKVFLAAGAGICILITAGLVACGVIYSKKTRRAKRGPKKDSAKKGGKKK